MYRLGLKQEKQQRLEGPPVISETYFASKYTSFWSDLLPGKNRYMRYVVNNDVEKIEPPLESIDNPSSRGLINYISFNLSMKSLTKEIDYGTLEAVEQNSQLFKSVFEQKKDLFNTSKRHKI